MPVRGEPRGSRGQSGQSLVELLVAMMLIGGVFLAITGALLTVTKATGTNKRTQAIDAALVSYGELVRDRDLVPYVSCPSTGSAGSATVAAAYRASAAAPAAMSTSGVAGATDTWRKPDGMTVDVVHVDAWDMATTDFVTDCQSPDGGAQRIEYSVTFQGVTRTAQIVKRLPDPS